MFSACFDLVLCLDFILCGFVNSHVINVEGCFCSYLYCIYRHGSPNKVKPLHSITLHFVYTNGHKLSCGWIMGLMLFYISRKNEHIVTLVR